MEHGKLLRAVAFSPDGQFILTGSQDGTVRLWDGAMGRSLGLPLQHPKEVLSVAISPDKLILTGCADGQARLWKLSFSLKGGVEQNAAWSQVLTGLKMGETGAFTVLSAEDWHKSRKQFTKLDGLEGHH